MYSPKVIPEHAPQANPAPRPGPRLAAAIAGDPRTASDDWTEEANRQAAALEAEETHAAETSIFVEFRRKLAVGEAVSHAVARLAEALRFSGRITITFHQGRVTKTVLEELYIRGAAAKRAAP